MTSTAPLTEADYTQRVLRVLVHIQEHLDEPLPVERLAAVACFPGATP